MANDFRMSNQLEVFKQSAFRGGGGGSAGKGTARRPREHGQRSQRWPLAEWGGACVANNMNLQLSRVYCKSVSLQLKKGCDGRSSICIHV